jgi:peptidoglycan biosynthesis protein MviN/MurJ (putative lipid II flippase)
MAAWSVWVIALLAYYVVREYADTPNVGLIVIIEVLVAAMVVCWIGALTRLWRQRARGWFAGVLILHLVGLGVIGMAAYAVAGPLDDDVPSRPQMSD